MKPSPARVAHRHLEAAVSPLELQRMAVRIERLQRTRTHGWNNADLMDFRNLMPGGRGRQVLPDPVRLRELAGSFPLSDEDKKWLNRNWRLWLAWAQRAEGHIRDNDPRNPKRMIRDMQRGKFPGMR
jgi:hypothetical protein